MRQSRRCFFRFLFGRQKGSGEWGQSPEYTDVEIKNKSKKRQVSDFFDRRKRQSRRCFFRFLFGHQKGSGEWGQSPEYTDIEIKNKKVSNVVLSVLIQIKAAFDPLRGIRFLRELRTCSHRIYTHLFCEISALCVKFFEIYQVFLKNSLENMHISPYEDRF